MNVQLDIVPFLPIQLIAPPLALIFPLMNLMLLILTLLAEMLSIPDRFLASRIVSPSPLIVSSLLTVIIDPFP